jgi:NitT/TauT family transport system substrate-binding protein
LRLGHCPNITHAQALVARSCEREGQSFLAEAHGAPVKVEWFAYNAGPSAMEAIFAKAIDAA